ncbi:unnamed protein product [Anisakis simplex]|uniref:BHLH domain-containing protein n=1 Tax=Anisakis simplex TaxID=6269 RepID=A0A0M3J399_ANISI|nr:unnamed protein product [Anisakis simplex]
MDPMVPGTPVVSNEPKKSPDTTDRKKATHLRCERQRREAINNGYQELKELLPASLTSLGCKTTNAAILFRAADYLTQLKEDLDSSEETISQLHAQVCITMSIMSILLSFTQIETARIVSFFVSHKQ